MRIIRPSVTAALVTALVMLAACSGGGVTGVAPAQAVLTGSFGQGPDNSCAIASSIVGIGNFVDGGDAVPVLDGATGQLGQIGIKCTVHASAANTYTVDGTITSGSNTVFVIHGNLTTTAPAGGIPNVNATLSTDASPNVTYAENDGGCTVTYATSTEGVSTGRVWGHIACPKATGQAGSTCALSADFRFENCVF